MWGFKGFHNLKQMSWDYLHLVMTKCAWSKCYCIIWVTPWLGIGSSKNHHLHWGLCLNKITSKTNSETTYIWYLFQPLPLHPFAPPMDKGTAWAIAMVTCETICYACSKSGEEVYSRHLQHHLSISTTLFVKRNLFIWDSAFRRIHIPTITITMFYNPFLFNGRCVHLTIFLSKKSKIHPSFITSKPTT